jgi:hypothetical protein
MSSAQTDCVVDESLPAARCTSACNNVAIVSGDITTPAANGGTACPTNYFCRKGDGACVINYSPKMVEESSSCACIGDAFTNSNGVSQTNDLADYVEGTSTTTNGLINNDYGEICNAWDADAAITPYPQCTDPLREDCGSENWCKLQWCYVNYACVQDTDVATGRSNAFDDVVMYYSYRKCGTPDCFASANNVGCPYGCAQTCDTDCGGDTGKTLDGAYWVGFQEAQTDEFDALVCVPCGAGTETDPLAVKTVSAPTVSPALQCNVCDTIYDTSKICALPASQEGYKFGVANRITGACTTETCAPKTGHVDVFCDDDYELYNGNTITMDICSTSNLDVTLRGCIPQGPATQWAPTVVTVNTVDYDLRLYQCDESSDCSEQGWCDTYFSDEMPGDDPAGHCRVCPYSSARCDDNAKYTQRAECKNKCFPSDVPIARDACTGIYEATPPPGNPNWIFGDTNCEGGEFCLLESDGGAPTSGQTYNGWCTICEINDPIGTGQCSLLDQFANSGSQQSCVDQCTLESASERTSLPDPAITVPFVRYSQLENMVGGQDSQITDVGVCGQYVYSAGAFGNPGGWDWTDYYHEICEFGWYGVPGGVQAWTVYANSEVDSNTGSGPCATRYCEHSKTEYVALVEASNIDITGGVGTHDAKANRCLVRVMNEGQPCRTTVTPKIGSQASLAGTCNSNGICIIEEGAECPVGSYAKTEQYILDNCSNSPRGREFETTFYGNRANDATGNFNVVPLAKASVCKSYAHVDNGKWPVVTWNNNNLGEIPATFGASTGGNIQDNWGRNINGNINGRVDTQFNWMIFSQYYMYDNTKQTVTFEAIGAANIKTGVGIICDPAMSDSLKSRYECIISDTGLYSYQGADISVFENSNSTTRTYEINIAPSTFTYYNVFICPGVHTNLCFGEFECDYTVGSDLEDKQEYCKGDFTECEDAPFPTNDPTLDPTMDPTSPPTVTTTSTAHGDPIIWTFYEECYDLNKDGLYDATVNPRFDHSVKIGVYNDFMRELVVVDDNDNIMISINSLGVYEHDENNWPHAFSFEEKDCPAEMKQTECLGTYKEWIFDAQEFRYTVHLLRHDYKDNGIAEGDLGWHLDIYPKPYSGFYKAGHMDSYSGLFFENPLPQELEYCEGGSPRNDGTE